MAVDCTPVLLIGTDPLLTRDAARCLHRAGVRPVVLGPRACWRMRLGGDCSRLVYWSASVAPAEQLSLLCAGGDIVLAADAPATRLLAAHPARAASAVPSAAIIATLQDHWNLARFAIAIGLPKPLSLRADNAAQLQADPLLYPIITRPLQGEGGVRIHHSGRALPDDYPLLAQVHIPGWPVGASFLADHGRLAACAIFRQSRHGRPSFYHSRRVREYVEQFAMASRYHGAGHLSWRYDPARDAYYLLSWKPGLHRTMLAAERAGVNFPYLLLRLALKQPLALSMPRASRILLANTR